MGIHSKKAHNGRRTNRKRLNRIGKLNRTRLSTRVIGVYFERPDPQCSTTCRFLHSDLHKKCSDALLSPQMLKTVSRVTQNRQKYCHEHSSVLENITAHAVF